MSEGKERVIRHVQIARHILHLHVAGVSGVGVLDWAASGKLVVVERLLPHSAGETHGELAARSDISEQGVDDRGASLDAREPNFHDGRHMLRGPIEYQRPAGENEQDDRLAGCDYSLEQLLLVPGQIQVRARRGFAAHVARLAQGEDGDIRILSPRQPLRQTRSRKCRRSRFPFHT